MAGGDHHPVSHLPGSMHLVRILLKVNFAPLLLDTAQRCYVDEGLVGDVLRSVISSPDFCTAVDAGDAAIGEEIHLTAYDGLSEHSGWRWSYSVTRLRRPAPGRRRRSWLRALQSRWNRTVAVAEPSCCHHIADHPPLRLLLRLVGQKFPLWHPADPHSRLPLR
jgi:hypothetical protein